MPLVERRRTVGAASETHLQSMFLMFEHDRLNDVVSLGEVAFIEEDHIIAGSSSRSLRRPS